MFLNSLFPHVPLEKLENDLHIFQSWKMKKCLKSWDKNICPHIWPYYSVLAQSNYFDYGLCKGLYST